MVGWLRRREGSAGGAEGAPSSMGALAPITQRGVLLGGGSPPILDALDVVLRRVAAHSLRLCFSAQARLLGARRRAQLEVVRARVGLRVPVQHAEAPLAAARHVRRREKARAAVDRAAFPLPARRRRRHHWRHRRRAARSVGVFCFGLSVYVCGHLHTLMARHSRT